MLQVKYITWHFLNIWYSSSTLIIKYICQNIKLLSWHIWPNKLYFPALLRVNNKLINLERNNQNALHNIVYVLYTAICISFLLINYKINQWKQFWRVFKHACNWDWRMFENFISKVIWLCSILFNYFKHRSVVGMKHDENVEISIVD